MLVPVTDKTILREVRQSGINKARLQTLVKHENSGVRLLRELYRVEFPKFNNKTTWNYIFAQDGWLWGLERVSPFCGGIVELELSDIGNSDIVYGMVTQSEVIKHAQVELRHRYKNRTGEAKETTYADVDVVVDDEYIELNKTFDDDDDEDEDEYGEDHENYMFDYMTEEEDWEAKVKEQRRMIKASYVGCSTARKIHHLKAEINRRQLKKLMDSNNKNIKLLFPTFDAPTIQIFYQFYNWKFSESGYFVGDEYSYEGLLAVNKLWLESMQYLAK